MGPGPKPLPATVYLRREGYSLLGSPDVLRLSISWAGLNALVKDQVMNQGRIVGWHHGDNDEALFVCFPHGTSLAARQIRLSGNFRCIEEVAVEKL